MARCTIEPDTGGRLKVKYVPSEVGIFTILLDWNGIEVDGCPFHPRIVDPSKIQAVTSSNIWTGPNHLKVQVGEIQSIVFDCQHGGPGTLRVTVEGPEGDVETDLLPVNADINLNVDLFVLKFMPRKEADYYIRAYWSDMPIEIFPIIATAVKDIDPPSLCPHLPPVPEPPAIRPELVGIHGPGISLAYICDQADFVIDGHEAGPGVPEVKMIGLKCDIEVTCSPAAEGVYACAYVPELAGAYLLSVLWSGQHVPGSPFKVSVMSCSDASKVHVSGEGLNTAVCNRDTSVLIDTRRAGCGAIEAKCKGPSRMAYCTLLDRYDGSYELVIRPQEVGMHILEIKYGNEPIPGSPFSIKVTSAPDPTRVKVTGDGIRNGLLATFQSNFLVDTRGAGPGQLTVKVRGPKGAFRVEMTRQPGNDRSIQCRYYPTEVGVYQVYVLWSGEHVNGSPFRVHIVDTLEQLHHLSIQQESANIQAKLMNGYDTARLSTISVADSNRALMFSDDF
jgi:filamin